MSRDIVAVLETADHNSFPNIKDYHKRYLGLAQYLDENVHPEVVQGEIAADGGLLNDHGPDHIRAVIQRASSMLPANMPIRPYEIYLLLCAIHFHDVGNIFGRAGHEQRHMTIMQEIKPLLRSDAAEIRCIGKIANAHGGKVEGNPDKIGLLQEDPVNGEDVQMWFIAAILRFADELADDKNRASRFLLDHELIPEESQVYHKYSSCLESVMVRPDEQCIDLHFVLSSNDATNFWGKKLHNGEIDQVYLIDEIYARTYKMHLERTYCSRFLRPHVDLTRINVKIEIIDDPHTYAAPEESIEYRLEETGYPGGVDADIHSLCEGLQTGKELAERIKIVRDI